MKPTFRAIALTLLALQLTLAAATDAQTDPTALLRRMTQVNSTLQSYTAKTHVDIALHTFPFLSPGLDGNYYFKQPDKQALVFDTVPVLAQQFQKVYPKIDPPAKWATDYNITIAGTDANTTTLRLTPKKQGRVTHLDVKVDNATATTTSFTWTYDDGGYVTFDQQYARVDGNYLVKSQSGKVDLPSYKADVQTTFSNFKVNVAVPDSVFSS